MAPDVATIFLVTAVLTFVGFAAGRLFQRTRFPDVLMLLGLGLLAGPVNRWLVERGHGLQQLADALDPATLLVAAPYIAGVALVVLLFDAGMEMDFHAFRNSIGPAAVHTLPIFVLTVAGVAGLCYVLLGMPLVLGIMLGIALANVDQTVSTGLLKGMHISSNVRAIYYVEMAMYDLISIPLLVSIIQISSGVAGADGSTTFLRGFVVMLAVSLAIGLVAGLLWVYALRRLQGHPNSYMLTFATCLAVYGASDFFDGSGALSVLLFGLVVGNRAAILRQFETRWRSDGEHEKVQAFHEEISFFVRTVFFLFVGVSFSIDFSVPSPGTSLGGVFDVLGRGPLLLGATALLMTAVIIGGRYLPIRLSRRRHPQHIHLFPVFGRGLDTAVLATLPFLAGAFVAGTPYYEAFNPWKQIFVNLSLLGILLSVIASSLAVWAHDRRYPPQPGQSAPAGPGAHPSPHFFQPARDTPPIRDPPRRTESGPETSVPMPRQAPASAGRAAPARQAPSRAPASRSPPHAPAGKERRRAK